MLFLATLMNEREIAGLPGLEKEEKLKLGLSRETLQGLRITGEIDTYCFKTIIN